MDDLKKALEEVKVCVNTTPFEIPDAQKLYDEYYTAIAQNFLESLKQDKEISIIDVKLNPIPIKIRQAIDDFCKYLRRKKYAYEFIESIIYEPIPDDSDKAKIVKIHKLIIRLK